MKITHFWKACFITALTATLAVGCASSGTKPAVDKGAQEQAGKGTTFASAGFDEPVMDGVGDDPQVVLTLGGIQPEEDPSTEALFRLAESANKLSGGSLVIEVRPDSELGSAQTQIEAMELDRQDMFVDSNWMGTLMRDKTVDTMWFLFDSAESYQKYVESDLNKEFEQRFCDEQHIRIIASNWYRTPRSFVSKKPLQSPEDFAGLRIRVPGLTGYYQSADAIGAYPVEFAWSETRLALQRGAVHAAEGPLDSLYTMGFYEEAPYVTVSDHLWDSMQVMISNASYARLTEGQRAALAKASYEAGEWYTKQARKEAEEARRRMEENGATITTMSGELASELRRRCLRRAQTMDADGTYWKAGTLQKVREAAESGSSN